MYIVILIIFYVNVQFSKTSQQTLLNSVFNNYFKYLNLYIKILLKKCIQL